MNPRTPFDESVSEHTEVSFVPMAAVEEESGRLDASQIRTLGSVRHGYTSFQENDVIFAKITPCMENGKIALATGLKNGLAFGSTEFFVFRPYEGVLPRFILYFLLQRQLRESAERQMTGASGQKRVPSQYLLNYEFWLPPTHEQERVVAKLDASLSKLERAEMAAHRAQERLKRYRIAVLHAAVTGELTRKWRKTQKPDETGLQILQRLLKARRAQWEQVELRRLSKAGKPLKDDKWKTRYAEPAAPNTTNLPKLPRYWAWASLDQCFNVERGRFSVRPRNDPGYYGGPHPFVQIGNLPREGGLISKYSQTLNDKGLSVSKKFQRGTILIAIVGGTIANTGILGFDACCPDSLVAVQSDDGTLRGFADIWLRANKFKLRASAVASGGQPNINLGILLPFAIALPPLTEQAEIIREVDRRLAASDRLAVALSRQLGQARVTRQSLLDDAFAGRLVVQNLNDQSAAALLDRIRVVREAEAKKSKDKRMSQSKSKSTRRPLLDVLREHKKPMTPEMLFRDSGFEAMFNENEEQQDVVDAFYKELRKLTGKPARVSEQKDSKHEVMLKVLP